LVGQVGAVLGAHSKQERAHLEALLRRVHWIAIDVIVCVVGMGPAAAYEVGARREAAYHGA
jgi:hypothetical protein